MDAHKSSGAKIEREAKEEHQHGMIMLNKPLDQDQEEDKKLASSTSSPSHEFSFTISLHPAGSDGRDRCRATSPAPAASFAIDLSPADDIFFHGHLLPLHLLSHIHSTTSGDDDVHRKPTSGMAKKKLPNSSNSSNSPPAALRARGSGSPVYVTRVRSKPKSFSLFRLSKWRRPLDHKEAKEKEKKEEEEETKPAAGFDVGRALKRYAKVVRTPLLLFGAHGQKGAGEKSDELPRQPHSFSGGSNSRWKELGGERRGKGGGQFSAPASMRTSPTNSGLLVATSATISSPNDGTMEELQSAIQAAIAHCKNSIAAQDDMCKS